jgi:signal transduction histidine kinase
MHQLQDNQCALRRAHDALEGRVRKRTAELAQSNELLKNEIAERKRAQEVKQQLLRRLVVVQEEERRRVARELHDQTGQYLTALMLGLEALREPERSPLGNQVGVARVQELTMELMQETHRLARRLRPAVLDDLGLHGALCHHLEEWSQYAGVSVDFHSPDFDTQRLPPDFETTLYRVVQEALTNVLRHAQAARVSVLLERRGSHVLLIVEDDGAGFDVKAVVDAPDARGRLGLIGMQERVEMLGGDLEIESATGAGTTVFVRIPISPENPCLSGKSLEGSVL